MENKSAFFKLAFVLGIILLKIGSASAESITGRDYTNFGADLNFPIFPKQHALKIFEDRSGLKLLKEIPGEAALQVDKFSVESCLKKDQTWVKCRVAGVTGWIQRSTFLSADELDPLGSWPFRYWLFIASNGGGGEESQMLWKAVPNFPYLIKPKDFDNIFFLVYFDEKGFAISPKNGKKTGDRVFVINNAIYLAPDIAKQRIQTKFLFLGFYNKEMQAICPGSNSDSCYSAVNVSESWPGIKKLNTSPDQKYAYDQSRQKKEHVTPWYGAEQVAFARHSDPVISLLYLIPDDVSLTGDISPKKLSEQTRNRLRSTPVCLVDCKDSSERIKLDPKPSLID